LGDTNDQYLNQNLVDTGVEQKSVDRSANTWLMIYWPAVSGVSVEYRLSVSRVCRVLVGHWLRIG